MERINPYWDHRSEVTIRGGVLEVRKNPGWLVDRELVEMNEDRAKPLIAGRVIPANPFVFHARFFWKYQIPFRIFNPHIDAGWSQPEMVNTTQLQTSIRAKLGRVVLAILRRFLSQNARNHSINLLDLLQCPACHSSELRREQDVLSVMVAAKSTRS